MAMRTIQKESNATETLRSANQTGSVKNALMMAALSAVLVSPITISTVFAAEEKVVNFYNWPDYIDPVVIKSFEQETGIKVNYDVYDSNEVLEAKMMTSGSGYDVVVPAGSFLERQAKAGIYTQIDRSKLSNYSNLDTELLDKIAAHDPGNLYNVPYSWGTVGLGYNVEMIKARVGDMPTNTLDLIFKPELAAKFADCGISILDSPAEVTSIALNYLGLDPNSEKKSDLKKASALLKAVRPHFKQFASNKYIADLANGDVCLALGYNGDIAQAQMRADEAGQNVQLQYVVPKEGTLAWFDLMAIPKDAPHPEAAYQFINYLLKGQSGAGIANYAFFAVPNLAADTYLLDEVKNDPSLYPPEAIKQKLFTQTAHSAKFDRLLSRAWTNLKTNR